MSYKVWGNKLDAPDLLGTSKYVTFKPNKNLVLRAVRTSFIVYNDPVFTNLNAKIYTAGDNNAPGLLLYTSTDSRTKAEIHTRPNGDKSTYFTFADIPLQANTYYNVVVNGQGYIPTANSHLAWRLAFPDPVYRDPLFTYGFSNLNRCPYDLHIIAGEF